MAGALPAWAAGGCDVLGASAPAHAGPRDTHLGIDARAARGWNIGNAPMLRTRRFIACAGRARSGCHRNPVRPNPSSGEMVALQN